MTNPLSGDMQPLRPAPPPHPALSQATFFSQFSHLSPIISPPVSSSRVQDNAAIVARQSNPTILQKAGSIAADSMAEQNPIRVLPQSTSDNLIVYIRPPEGKLLDREVHSQKLEASEPLDLDRIRAFNNGDFKREEYKGIWDKITFPRTNLEPIYVQYLGLSRRKKAPEEGDLLIQKNADQAKKVSAPKSFKAKPLVSKKRALFGGLLTGYLVAGAAALASYLTVGLSAAGAAIAKVAGIGGVLGASAGATALVASTAGIALAAILGAFAIRAIVNHYRKKAAEKNPAPINLDNLKKSRAEIYDQAAFLNLEPNPAILGLLDD